MRRRPLLQAHALGHDSKVHVDLTLRMLEMTEVAKGGEGKERRSIGRWAGGEVIMSLHSRRLREQRFRLRKLPEMVKR